MRPQSTQSTQPSKRPTRAERYLANESQEDRILELLQSRGEAWTPAPELAEISLQYCRAIRGLRKRGFQIENRTEQHGRVRHGFYRLAPIDDQPKATEARSSSPQPSPPQSAIEGQPTIEESLFDLDPYLRSVHRDDN